MTLLHHHSPRPTGGDPVQSRRPVLCGQEVPAAGHICAFFNSSEEKYSTLAPYFIDAIKAGDTVIDVMEAESCEKHIEALTEKGVDVHGATESGNLRLSTCEQTYMRAGKLDLDAVLEMLRETLHEARDEGRSVRTCGEMNWITRNHAASRAMEYEARVNEFVPTFKCTLLCVYDLAHTPSTLMSDILATHPFAVINGRLRANPYAVDPAEYVKMLRARTGFRQ